MSKNFELMQQLRARSGVQRSLDPDVADQSVAYSKNPKAATVPLSIDNTVREQCLKLVQSFFLLGRPDSPHLVAFASVDVGAGCSQVCAQVSQVLAEQRMGTVCVVDANFRAPTQAGVFGVENQSLGLADSLRGRGSIRNFIVKLGSNDHFLLPAGQRPAESLNLLTSKVMIERLEELRNEFDFVLIDCPPLNACSDAMTIGQRTDGLALVVEANMTRRSLTLKITNELRTAQIKILGTVLNNRTFPIPTKLYELL